MPALLRQSVYSRLADYEDVNDAGRLSVDPVMRAITGKKNNGNIPSRYESMESCLSFVIFRAIIAIMCLGGTVKTSKYTCANNV